VTLFEYIAIAFSMVQSFTVLRALSGVPHAIQIDRRYWVHLTWLGSTLATVLFSFWAFWGFKDFDWNFAVFAWVLVAPSLLYVFVSLLIPQDPSAVTSWREHFYSIRLRLFSTAIAWDLAAMLGSIINSGESRGAVHFMFAVLLLVHSVGAISSRPAVHAVLAIVPPVLVVVSGLTIYFLPLAPQAP
jgi:hypothetical protein